MSERCTIQAEHCENCGATDRESLQGSDGYTECCNELTVWSASECRNHHGDTAH